VQQKTDIATAEVALSAADKARDQISPLAPPVSDSGLTVSQSLADIVKSLGKLVDILDDFSKVSGIWL
jgi:hypothetical protein